MTQSFFAARKSAQDDGCGCAQRDGHFVRSVS
jgi:hypothetical protein